MITRLTAGPAAALAAGAILLVGPFFLGVTGVAASSAYILGAIAALVGAKALWRPEPWDAWLIVGAGALALAAPTAFGFFGTGEGATLHLLPGFVTLAAGFWTAAERRRSDHAGELGTKADDHTRPTAPIETRPGE